MFDHIGITTTNLKALRDWYHQALTPLGYEVKYEEDGLYCGLGPADSINVWLKQGDSATGNVHLAFTADNRKTVDEFYAAAMAAGGTDNGAPGLRPHYHENYYGAFVLDPGGNNIEAVCHLPE